MMQYSNVHIARWIIALLVLLAIPAHGAEDSKSLDIDFHRDVRSVLKERCFACHGALKQEAGLRLDTAASIKAGGDSGSAISTEQPDQSILLQRVKSSDTSMRMPPEGSPLTVEQIQNIEQWIRSGAVPPVDDKPEPSPTDHWAFKLPTRVPLNADQAMHPIDALLQQKLAKQNLEPRPIADKATRIRRLYLDLIGIPPTQQQLAEFLADSSSDAYDKVVRKLLDSPQYGERWGRHWMDVWRYADWFGRRYVPDVWNSAPQIWRWRDWIVNSLNEDKGYDQMVREMLAADEVCPENSTNSVATGYLIRNWYALNPNDWMRSNVEHTAKAFLGLTFHCAHCHDHKYDPITQEDYFKFRAFFEPIYVRQDRVAGQPDPGPFQDYNYSTLRKVQRLGSVRVFDKVPEAPTWFYTGGDERNRLTDRGTIAPGVPEFLKDAFERLVEPVNLPPAAWYPGMDKAIRQTISDEITQRLQQAEKDLSDAQSSQTQSHDAPTDAQKTAFQQAEKEYLAALEEEKQKGQLNALVGKQSLLLDATVGRRMIYHPMNDLTSVEKDDCFEFQVLLLSDTHFNFQLTKDSDKGLTATFIGWEKGVIKCYQPGGFNEFQVGAYDLAAGQNRFLVQLKIDPSSDKSYVTVRSISDDKVLSDQVPIALNGWNPVGDPTKGILFDARPGSMAVVDDIVLRRGAEAKEIVKFDFEPPMYMNQSEVVGIQRWSASSYCVAPAKSTCVQSIQSASVKKLLSKLESAKRIASRNELRVLSATKRIESAKLELAAFAAKITADDALYGGQSTRIDDAKRSELSKQASQLERNSELAKAIAEQAEAEYQLAVADSKPLDDPKRTEQLQSAQSRYDQSLAAVSKEKNDSMQNASENYTPLSAKHPQSSTGRRRALAYWITSPRNPLTARVAVNHMWMRHFHTPLVATVFDFGRNGAEPIHQDLLDWLAIELIESNWSMKHLHRLIVTSDTYQRMSSQGNGYQASIDPENKYYWRMNTGRMEAEVIRDSLLHLAGKLDLQMGGQELENNQAFTTFRRSLYYSCQPEEDGKSALSVLFDGPDPSDCYRRTRTVIPQQSLAMTNSDLVHELSVSIEKTISDKVSSQATTESNPNSNNAFIHDAYLAILARLPKEEEVILCEEFLHAQKAGEANSTETANRRAGLVRALLNHNDFITIR
jgi:hypothetical protein